MEIGRRGASSSTPASKRNYYQGETEFELLLAPMILGRMFRVPEFREDGRENVLDLGRYIEGIRVYPKNKGLRVIF